MTAHIVSGLPLPLQWGLALLIFGGGLLVFAVRRSLLRVAGGIAALCGAGGLIASWVLSPALIVAAPYAVRIVSPPPGAGVVTVMFAVPAAAMSAAVMAACT